MTNSFAIPFKNEAVSDKPTVSCHKGNVLNIESSDISVSGITKQRGGDVNANLRTRELGDEETDTGAIYMKPSERHIHNGCTFCCILS